MVGAVRASDVGTALAAISDVTKCATVGCDSHPALDNGQREKAAAKPNSHKTASMHLPGDAVRPILPVTAPSVESLKN